MSIKTIEAELKSLAEAAGTDIEHIYDEVLALIYGRKVEVRNDQLWRKNNALAAGAQTGVCAAPPPSGSIAGNGEAAAQTTTA